MATSQLWRNPLYPDMTDIVISEMGIRKLLANINPSKASGPRQYPSMAPQGNCCQPGSSLSPGVPSNPQPGYPPGGWKAAHITPIFKKEDRSAAANYRLVSLTCLCCKLMEHVIASNIMQDMECHNIPTDAQHGFQK